MSRLLVAQRALTVPGWAKNALWRSAGAVPSLDLRFADNKSLVDAVTGASLVTFTRASSGTFVCSGGVLQTAATDVPRFDHNPTTGESLGLLVEEQRTNSIANNTMVGAVAGTPGTNPTGWIYATSQSNGLTLSIVGTGVENGINYIDYRFNGTTVANPNACTIGIVNASAATAQTWTASTYWKLAAGSATGVTAWQLGLIENTAGGSFITGAFYAQTAPTSAALITQRPTATRTLSGGATVGLITYPINIAVAGNTVVDFTIRIGLPQLEQGAFATSPILTSTAAATRSADVASITGSAFTGFYRQDEGTMFADTLTQEYTQTTFPRVFSVDNGGAGTGISRIALVRGSGTRRWDYSVFDAGVSTVGLNNGIAPSAGAVCKGAVIYRANDFTGATQGVLMNTDTSGNVPTVNALGIGMQSNGVLQFNGTIRRLTFWPARLSDATLQTLTQ